MKDGILFLITRRTESQPLTSMAINMLHVRSYDIMDKEK
jgi:hypothetical protein